MPKSRVSKTKMFRDFSRMKGKYLNNNYLKNLHSARKKFCQDSGVGWKHLEFMIWAYDLEFFTIDYAAEEYEYNRTNMANRIIYPLQSDGYIYKHFERLTPSKTLEDHIFREETKYNYRVRYALSQRARLLVQRFYQSL
tara:strand:+ start:9195 stop:9611 length:417 start_codon:yes stop_codon:yes gene_type:complete